MPPRRTSCHCWCGCWCPVVLHDVGAVRGRGALHLERLVAVAVDQPDVAAVGVGEPELLVGAVQVGPLDDLRILGGGPVVDVEHLARVPRLQPVVAAARVDELPLLVVAVAARPLRDACAVVGGEVVDVHGLAAVAVHEHVPGARVDGLGSCGHRREREGRPVRNARARDGASSKRFEHPCCSPSMRDRVAPSLGLGFVMRTRVFRARRDDAVARM